MRSLSPGFCLAKCQTCFGYNVSNANYNLNEVSYSQKLADPVCFAKGVSAHRSHHKKRKASRFFDLLFFFGGDKGSRTPDLLNAIIL